MALSLMTFSITTLSITDLFATFSKYYAEHNNPLYLVSLCSVLRFIYFCAKCHYAECHYAECHNAMSRVARH
jgi:hypothetical protein